ILENHLSAISNTMVFNLLQNKDFYIKCCQISVILKPVKELTNCLEARTANLADVFIGLVKLAASINQVENSNPWKNNIITDFNQRFDELIQIFLGHGLKKTALDKIYKTDALIWNNLHYSKELCEQLLTEILNTEDDQEQLLQLALFLNENTNGVNNLDDNDNSKILESLTLNIVDFVNLALPEFSTTGDTMFFSESVTTNQDRDIGNMNYDTIELAHQMALQDDD
ncbi:24020_t:CDS:2, partial [Cetraspora pellucida]